MVLLIAVSTIIIITILIVVGSVEVSFAVSVAAASVQLDDTPGKVQSLVLRVDDEQQTTAATIRAGEFFFQLA